MNDLCIWNENKCNIEIRQRLKWHGMLSYLWLIISVVVKRSEFLQRKSFHTSSLDFKEDYYKILGVSKSADQKEIKKAYYKV